MGSDADVSRYKHRRSPSDVEDSEGELEGEKSSKRHNHRRHHRHRSKRHKEKEGNHRDEGAPPPPPLVVSNRNSNRAVDDEVEEGEILEEDGDTEFAEGKFESRNLGVDADNNGNELVNHSGMVDFPENNKVSKPENTMAEVRDELMSGIDSECDANTDIGQGHLKEDKGRHNSKGLPKGSIDPYAETTGGDQSKIDDRRKLSSESDEMTMSKMILKKELH